jgi:hypothetical protein
MSLNDDVKEAMRIAIAGGTLPKRGRSNQTTLNLKRNPGRSSYVLLARADGSLTKAGETYYGQNPSQIRPTSQFDYNTPIIKRGPNDYIRTRDGKESLIRSLKADGSTTVTRLGRSFFKNKQTEYVVQVPAIVSGRNRKGKVVDRKTFLANRSFGRWANSSIRHAFRNRKDK